MTSIPFGVPTVITQNVTYALPARTCRVTSLAAVEVSIDNSAWVALTNANTVGAESGALFIRCTTGNTTVVCKSL